MLVKNFSRRHFEIFSYLFQNIGFDVQTIFLGDNLQENQILVSGKSRNYVIKLLSAEFAHSTAKVNIATYSTFTPVLYSSKQC